MHWDFSVISEILQTISLNGNPPKPNDDRCGSTLRLAWIIDRIAVMGPPGLLGSQGDAAWLSADVNGCRARLAQAQSRSLLQNKPTILVYRDVRPVVELANMDRQAGISSGLTQANKVSGVFSVNSY